MAGRSKFNVSKDTSKRTYAGIVFDSAMEMRYYKEVVLPLYEQGDVVEYELQKPYILQPKFTHEGKTIQPIKYVADFYMKFKNGHELVVDIKGCPDSVALLKRKMFWYVFPELDYQWITYSRIDGGFVTYETVKAARKERKKAKEQQTK